MPLSEGAINEIMPFAPDGLEAQGDLMSLETYAAAQGRLRGHQPGIAQRALENRVLRQVSHIAAGLAQFIANGPAGEVRDDGDLDAVEEGLAMAMGGAIVAHAESRDHPGATTAEQGMVRLATAAEALAGTDGDTAVTPAAMAAAFGGTLSTAGWQRLPSGLIVQWLQTSFQAPTAGKHLSCFSAAWPMAFPNNLFSVQASVGSIAAPSGNWATLDGMSGSTKTHFSANLYTTTASAHVAHAWAIGN